MPRPTQQPRLGPIARWVLFFALAAFGISGATTIFLLGSHNRASDKEAVLRYEASILAQVREMSVVGGSMAEAADAYAAKKLAPKTFAASAAGFERTFSVVATRLEVIAVPQPFGAGQQMFAPAAREYAAAAKLYFAAADCAANGSPGCPTLNAGSSSALRALTLFRNAAKLLQDTRIRLGLERSPNFTDPPR